MEKNIIEHEGWTLIMIPPDRDVGQCVFWGGHKYCIGSGILHKGPWHDSIGPFVCSECQAIMPRAVYEYLRNVRELLNLS